MPRSTLQGQTALAEQPDPVLDLHPIMQSSTFPSSDIFQPAPGRDLTLTWVQLADSPQLRGAQHPAASNPCMNPALPASAMCPVPISAIVGSLHKQKFHPSFHKENPFIFYCVAQI